MSPLDHYAHRAALRARRLRVIEALMDGATGVRLATLVERYLLEVRR